MACPLVLRFCNCSESGCMREYVCRSGVDVRSMGSSAGFGVGLQAGIHSSGSTRRNRKSGPGGEPPLPKGFDVLPASARYGYYRLYGEHLQDQHTYNYGSSPQHLVMHQLFSHVHMCSCFVLS